jgi:hypothetical protein
MVTQGRGRNGAEKGNYQVEKYKSSEMETVNVKVEGS